MSHHYSKTVKKYNIDKPTPILIRDLGMIQTSPNNKQLRRMGLFKCPYCGNEFTSNIHGVLSGKTKSCGCYNRLIAKPWKHLVHYSGKDNNMYKHGGSDTKLYYRWRAIINRTSNPSVCNYSNYGGRGICMCNEWKKSFEAFSNWAISSGYRDDLVIDRIDVNGHYEPNNCRWVSNSESAQNRRNKENHGIYKHKYGYVVSFRREGKYIYLGLHKDYIDAVSIRDNFLNNEKNNRKTH